MSMKDDNKKVLMYDGENCYTFIHVTIWECVRFWLMTKIFKNGKWFR